MTLVWLYLLGLAGVFAHVISKVIGKGEESVKALGDYWRVKSLTVVFSIMLYTGLFCAWQWSNALEFLGWYEGQLNGAVFLLGYFSNSILGHIAKTKPYGQPPPNPWIG